MAKLKTVTPNVSTPTRKLLVKAVKPAAATKPVEAAPAVKPTPIASQGKPASQPRFVHNVKDLYQGPSPTTNTGKSRTPWKNSEFGTQPQRSLTARTEAGAKALRDAYGKNPFKRGNIDSGVANVLIVKGFLRPLDGDGRSEDDTYEFTPEALNTRFASPKA